MGFSESVNAAWTSTVKEANKAKGQTELSMLEFFSPRGHESRRRPDSPWGGRARDVRGHRRAPRYNLKQAKREFGVEAWDLVAKDDTAGLKALYEKRKPAIGKLEADIAAKQLELVALGSAAPTQLVDVEVPAGAAPGSAVEAQASDGSVVKITVPEGAKPGDKLKVRVPKVMPATAVPAPAENVPTVTGTPAPPEKQASMVEEP